MLEIHPLLAESVLLHRKDLGCQTRSRSKRIVGWSGRQKMDEGVRVGWRRQRGLSDVPS